MKEKTSIEKKKEVKEIAKAECYDRDCPIHGNLRTRGKVFEGTVVKILNKKATIEFERRVFIKKYERYAKSKTKIHARLPKCMETKIKIGDLIKVQECRPLSKIIHSAVIEKIKDANDNGEHLK